MSSEKEKVLILGGGVTGLISAHTCITKQLCPILVETSSQMGGMISTLETEWGLVERAANGILNSPEVEALLEDLDVNVIPHQPASRRRYLWNGKVTRLPVSLFSLIQGVIGFFTIPAQPLENESLFSWCERIFGKQIASMIIEPAIGGIYGTPLDVMDPRMIFSSLDWEPNQSLFSLVKKAKKKNPSKKQKPKRKGLISFKGGMGELVRGLEKKIAPHSEMYFNQTNYQQASLPFLLREFPVKQVRICLPASKVWELLKRDPQTSAVLDSYCTTELPHLSIFTVTRFSREDIFQKPGFGILFPKHHGFHANGILSNSSIFPFRTTSPETRSETWIFAGEHVQKQTESELLELLEKDRTKILGKSLPPLAVYPTLWKDAFPVYGKELYPFNQCLDALESSYLQKGIHLKFYGNYRRGIGLRSIIEKISQEKI